MHTAPGAEGPGARTAEAGASGESPPLSEAERPDPASTHVVAVRTLCEFTARRGDLDLRFTPAPSAQEGIAGHQLVASRRPAHYQSEVSLAGDHDVLRVRGRADGFDPQLQQLEEVKTYRGDLDAMPDNHRQLHWAQAMVYGCLLCRKLCLDALNVALVYFDIGNRTETVLVRRFDAKDLEESFRQRCEEYLHWARLELAHRSVRDAGLRDMPFAHAGFRAGQRQLAETVYRAALNRRCLMAEAPTGIGKTIGTLFPLLKAVSPTGLDKVFYLTAKTSGRELGLQALDQLGRKAGADLRVLELVAREKACEHPGNACHGDSCPLAKGFFDRLPAARGAALERSSDPANPANPAILDQAAIRRIALTHGICPYYLGQELARWADVVVGDYNYYFDFNAMLHGWTLANQWRVGVLVDEAHNLVERARRMYSAELDQRLLRTLRATAPACLRPSLTTLDRAWNHLHRDQTGPYQAHDALPGTFLATLQQAGSAITEHLSAQPIQEPGDLLHFYFDLLHFIRLAEVFGDHSIFDVSRFEAVGRGRAGSVLCLRNVVPARFLRPRLAAAATVTLFSATLRPRRFQADLLGLPESTAWLEVDSPFEARQLSVQVVRDVSTRYRDRAMSVAPIGRLIAEQYAREPGNYLAFFSSFDYLKQVADWLGQWHPEVPRREQSRGMSESEQARYLAAFEIGGRGVAFAVLGGSFGEAIDLPGDRLRGAFIATLGLPQVNPVNEQMRRRMQACFGSGYDYAYLFPGLQKVVQAAGRVIRGPEDRGVLFLIDDRFAQHDVRRLLPSWWAVDLRPGARALERQQPQRSGSTERPPPGARTGASAKV